MLTIHITRVSPTEHRLYCERADGTSESAVIETKSFLVHDLLHFALETEAKRTEGFFGLIAQGRTFAQVNNKAPSEPMSDETREVEQAVGVLTGIVKSGADARDGIAMLENLYAAYGTPMPSWLTAEMFERAKERYRKLLGRWNSLAFGETLELAFGK